MLLKLMMRRLWLVGGSFTVAKIKPESGGREKKLSSCLVRLSECVAKKGEDLHEALNALRWKT